MQKIANGSHFITGIDTDAGKSYATAILARRIAGGGRSVITQKFIQTGCTDSSEDIETHRRIMGIPMQDVDIDGTTCPEIFRFPSSPHLAAALESRTVDLDLITKATRTLESSYDVVLIEGAGGLLVPITEEYTTADYIIEHELPLMLVTSPRLGSINHTLLSLEVCRYRGIVVEALIYNHYPADADGTISDETFAYLSRYIAKYHPTTHIYETEYIK